jgi:hypothetical protein
MRYRFDFDRFARKAGATWVNFAIVLGATEPLYPLLSVNLWKAAAVGNCFIYTMLFRRRCIGMMVFGTYMLEPVNAGCALLYSAGFATLLYWVLFPFDLLLVAVGAQFVCLVVTGDTIHAKLTGAVTMTREAYVELCKNHAREYLKLGNLRGAVAAMAADLGRWNDLRPPAEITLIGIDAARAGDRRRVEQWVEGFK